MGLGKGVETAVGHVGQGQRGGTEPASHSNRLANCGQALRQARTLERERDDEVGQAVLAAHPDRTPIEGGRAIGGGRERLAPDRVANDPDARPAVHDQGDRDAEDRDAVGVVDRAVKWIDHPYPAVARWRRARFLRQEPIVWVGLADGAQNERLAQVIDLGHHVLGALVGDRADLAQSFEQQVAGPRPHGHGQVPFVGERVGAHGPLHSTASGRSRLPRAVTSRENEIVRPGSTRGLSR